MYKLRKRTGVGLVIPAVICLVLAEPTPLSVRWCARWSTVAAAAASAAASAGPLPESVGAPWTCGHSGYGPSRNVCRTSDMQTPSRPPPCVSSCGILVTLAGDTGSHKPHTCGEGKSMRTKFSCSFERTM